MNQKLQLYYSRNETTRLRIDALVERCREENQARRDMLQLWESTVGQMAKRESDFEDLAKVMWTLLGF
ncbi:unnamed protein product [Protopolystoma xenopodis]|uniref:Uncharacterized protein n=1 Tax=Protopolystoma xenopodis TaxID=117903 RepID=A0A448WUY8_9PLAT|nr:unnamed protein product [Protopolystoma xenopodis]